ncbi:MAG TPA: diguanylate cyclase [Nevskiaceae bacterium]|nr:diguanylate cyclase [Nevskiaceae bacterium]
MAAFAPFRALATALPLAPPTLLIVDDSRTNRLALRRCLEGVGAQILEAASGAEALIHAEREDLLMVLLDVQMPGMDGFQTARSLRELSRHRDTPILFVSAERTEPDHARHGYALGALDYLVSKPLDEAVLRHKVAALLSVFNRKRELEQRLARAEADNQALFDENEHFRVRQEDLQYQATHDALTGLPNRLLFEDRLGSAIQRSARNRSHFALMFVDLDNFKEINDRHGHAAGDEVLVGVARRLSESVRGSDTVARIGGDEFGLLIEALEDGVFAFNIARKVHQNLGLELPLANTRDGRPVRIRPGASIGLALFPDHARSREELLMLADLAMYQVKESGGGAVRLYERREVLRADQRGPAG